jgi:DNA-binding YbaB/EbfC family protein
MLKGLGALGDMTKMMKAAQEMQGKLAALQEELGQIVVLGEAGGGTVKARVTAKGTVTGLDIDPSLLDPAQKEVVEDLIVAAIRDAQIRGNERAQTEMARIAEEMGLPPGMGMPG